MAGDGTSHRHVYLMVFMAIIASLGSLLPPLLEHYQTDAEDPDMLENTTFYPNLAEQMFECNGNPLAGLPSAKPDAPSCMKLGNTNKSFLPEQNQYAFTRQRKLFESVVLPKDLNAVQQYTQQKEFVWTSITSGEWMFGVALLRFGYVNNVVLNLYNSKSSQSFWRQIEIPLVAPFFGPHFQPNENGDVSLSAPGHCVTFNSLGLLTGGTEIAMCVAPSGKAVVVDVNTTFNRCAKSSGSSPELSADPKGAYCTIPFSIKYEFQSSPHDFMQLVFPLGPRRASQVTKIAGAPVNGVERFSILDNEIGFRPGSTPLVSVDYTRGLLRRETLWKWASMSGLAVDKKTNYKVPFGMHLSTGTYDYKGASVESTIYGPTMKSVEREEQKKIDILKFGGSKATHRVNFLDDPSIVIKPLSSAPKGDIDGDGETKPDSEPFKKIWEIRNQAGTLNLIFTPAGPHFLGSFHYGVLEGDLYHMWGTFTGTVPKVHQTSEEQRNCMKTKRNLDDCVLHVKDLPGVIEDHYALW